MNWIQLIDKHFDGLWFVAVVAILGVTIVCGLLAVGLCERWVGRR